MEISERERERNQRAANQLRRRNASPSRPPPVSASAPVADGADRASKSRDGLPPLRLSVSADDDLFKRRIEFHPARKPFSGFALSGGDFHIETLNPSSDPRWPAPGGGSTSSAASGKRPDGGELRQRGLDPELKFEITYRRIGAGLANLGNTCFLNSVLQCLTYTEPFAAYLQSGKHKSSCHAAGFCAMCALQSHVMDALQSTGKILRPFHLVKNLRCISRNFRNSRQEDAHEYMINLLESMHKCCLPSGVASESPSAFEKSLVHKIFGGRLRSQVKCMQCSYCSNKFDPFLDLSLEIVKADTLCKALSHFTSKEQLDGGERQYQCQQCKQKVRALKQLTIHKAPYVFTIHLKRFGSDVPGQKIDKKVDFESTLDLKPYVSDPSEGDLKYTLYGVLVHAGYGTHSGHYFCFVRTSSGMWHSLNDHQVCQVSEKTVLQQKAYMLFYVRNVRSSAPKRAQDLPVAFDFKEAIQDHPRNRGSTTSEFYTAISKTDASYHGESMPLKGISISEHLLKKDSVMPTNGLVAKAQQSTLLEDHIFHSSSKISSVKMTSKIGSPLHNVTGHHLVAEGLVHLASSKDNGNHLLEKDDLQNKNVKGNGTSYKVVRSLVPKEGTISNHSHAVGSPDDLRLNQVECRDAMANEGESNDPVVARLCRNALMEADQIDPRNKQCTSHDSAQMEPMKPSDSQKVLMKRKVPKSVYERNMRFGSRRLFLVTLNLQKRKNHRIKKRCMSTKDIRKAGILEDNNKGDEGASTSVMVSMVDVDSVHSPKQRSHTSSGWEHGFCGGGDVNNVSSGSANVMDADVGGRYANNSAERSLFSRTGQHCRVEACTSSKSYSQLDTMNLLKRGFWELPIPQWDGIELPPVIDVKDDKPQSIGYILDEWEKELDRGKRKKVKSSRKSFGGGNPFQDIAAARAQKKMKMDWTSSGNSPFRINS